MKKNFYLMIDTETAGTLEEPLVYDIGIAVVDKQGNVYEAYSFVVAEVFYGMKELMQTAYYAEKIPNYLIDIDQGTRRVARFFYIWSFVRALIKEYHITACIAHNMRFDLNALNHTARVLSENQHKYFFPYGVKLWCTLAMARSIMTYSSVYKQWCAHYGFTLKNGTPRMTAEVLYRFITNNPTFEEKHTGIEDVMIEKDIFAYLCRKHKKMQRTYWKE